MKTEIAERNAAAFPVRSLSGLEQQSGTQEASGKAVVAGAHSRHWGCRPEFM